MVTRTAQQAAKDRAAGIKSVKQSIYAKKRKKRSSSSSRQAQIRAEQSRLKALKPGTLAYQKSADRLAQLKGKSTPTRLVVTPVARETQLQRTIQRLTDKFQRGSRTTTTLRLLNKQLRSYKRLTGKDFIKGDKNKILTEKQKLQRLNQIFGINSDTGKLVKRSDIKIPKSENFKLKKVAGTLKDKATIKRKGLEKFAENISNFEDNVNQYLIKQEQKFPRSYTPGEPGAWKKTWKPKEIANSLARFVYGVSPSLLLTGAKGSLAVAVTSKRLISRDKKFNQQFKDFNKDAAKKAGQSLLRAYDIRTPGGIANVLITAITVKGIGSARAQNLALNKQLSQSKVINSASRITKTPSGYRIETIGKLKMPKIKYLGKDIKGQTVKFTKISNIKGKRNIIDSSKILKEAYKQFDTTKLRITTPKGKTLTKTLKAKGVKKIEKTAKVDTAKAGTLKGTETIKSELTLKGRFGKVTSKALAIDKKTIVESISRGRIESSVNKILRIGKGKRYSVSEMRSFIGESKPLTAAYKLNRLSNQLKSINLKNLPIKTKVIVNSNIKFVKQTLSNLQRKVPKIKVELKSLKGMGKRGQARVGFKTEGRWFDSRTGSLKKIKDTNIDTHLKKFDAQLKEISKTPSRIKITKTDILKTVNTKPIFKIKIPIITNKILLIGLANLNRVDINSKINSLVNEIDENIPRVENIVKVTEDTDPGIQNRSVSIVRSGSTPLPPNPIFTPQMPLIVTPRIIPTGFKLSGGRNGATRLFSIPLQTLPKGAYYSYSADLYSKMFGVKATKKEREKLLKTGRVFTGFEIRKLV